MLMLITIMVIAAVAITLYAHEPLWADPSKSQVDGVIEKFQNVFRDNSAIREYLFNAGTTLFWILGFIQFAWNLYQLVLEGKFDIQNLILTMTRTMFILAIMWYFYDNAVSHFTTITSGFRRAGESLSGAGTTAKLLSLGTKIPKGLFDAALAKFTWFSGIPLVLVAGICSIIILLAFAGSILTLIIGLCKMYMSITVAIYFVGFASCDYTRGIAITAYKSVFCASVEVFVMYLLFGIGNEIFPSFFSDVQSMDSSDIIPLCFQMIIATFVFTGAMRTLPQFASGIVAGSPLGGGVQAGSGAALAGALAGAVTTGIATVTGAGLGAFGGVKMAGAMGGGKWSKIGHGLAGAAKGAFGGEHGAVGNLMRQSGYGAVRRGIEKRQPQYNNITPPGGNPNNVNP